VVRLRKECKLSVRERDQLARIYRPSGVLRSDRGARVLPRATFEALEIAFAYDPAAPDRTFAAMDELTDRLTHRNRGPEGRDRSAGRTRTPAAAAG
jgi:hypothetical protein